MRSSNLNWQTTGLKKIATIAVSRPQVILTALRKPKALKRAAVKKLGASPGIRVVQRRWYQPLISRKDTTRHIVTVVAIAAEAYPMVNSQMDGDEIVTPQFVDVGIAVSTPKGLMVSIVRNAETKSIPQIELEIKQLAEKARTKKITVDELTGGSFTITNGGVFGSLLSTPIINPPQSAILGMHNILDRPIAVDGQVVIRPMMFTALSYDHRIIDGKDSVGFLVKVKEMIENPGRMFTEGKDAGSLLLGI